MAKALFLDVDGVLNSSGSCLARTGQKWDFRSGHYEDLHVRLTELIGDFPYLVTQTVNTIDPTAVELVNRLFEKEPELVLVLSTSHRALFQHLGYGSALHLEALGVYFKMLGIHAPVYDVTPIHGGTRGQEVAAYLDAHPEIDEHLAIDDGEDFDPRDCTFLRIDPSVGFTGRDYFLATRHLLITESNIIV